MPRRGKSAGPRILPPAPAPRSVAFGGSGGPGFAAGSAAARDLDQVDPSTIEAALITDRGTMVVTFFPEQAPKHVKGFLTLAQHGFCDGISFHRVMRNFMVQTGCPNRRKGATGTPGTGGPG